MKAALFAFVELLFLLFESVAHGSGFVMRNIFVYTFPDFANFRAEVTIGVRVNVHQDGICVAPAACCPVVTVANRTAYFRHPHALLSKWGLGLVWLVGVAEIVTVFGGFDLSHFTA
ncbi:hypothetical protein [Tumebacillus algifaecis]